jgi:hypothetical protein
MYRQLILQKKGFFFFFTINGITIETKYVNMAKPFAIDVSKKIKKSNDIKLIYDHILNIWCSKNEELLVRH